MKQYPEIPHHSKNQYMYFFDKLDGQNIRMEYEKKRGWYKYGSRGQLVARDDKHFGNAFAIFHQPAGLAERMEEVILRNKWIGPTTIFCEYWGKESFIGMHKPGDEMFVTLIDISPHRKGILPPDDFIKIASQAYLNSDKKEVAKYLGKHYYCDEFRKMVYLGALSGITYEGVIGKAFHGNQLIMVKIKTDVWRDRVLQTIAENEAKKILES